MLPELRAKMTVHFFLFYFCFGFFLGSKLEYSEFPLASLMCGLPNLAPKCSHYWKQALYLMENSYLPYIYLKIVTVNNHCNYSIAFTAQIQLKMSGQLILM